MKPASEWETKYIGTSVYRFASVDSTQAEVRRLIAEGRGEGALVVAESQTAGRGRFERSWHSPAGNMYLSLGLRPPISLPDWPQIMMLASLALVETLDEIGIADATIKWPNDVLVGGLKVAGLLAEIEGPYLILGIGINVNAPLSAALPHATSLRIALGHAVNTEAVLRDLVLRMDSYFEHLVAGQHFTPDWARRMSTLNRQVRVHAGYGVVEGIAESVTLDGALCVRKRDGTLATFHSGEVTLTSDGGLT